MGSLLPHFWIKVVELMSKPNYGGLDWLKFVASILVVANHMDRPFTKKTASPQPRSLLSYYFNSLFRTLRICVLIVFNDLLRSSEISVRL